MATYRQCIMAIQHWQVLHIALFLLFTFSFTTHKYQNQVHSSHRHHSHTLRYSSWGWCQRRATVIADILIMIALFVYCSVFKEHTFVCALEKRNFIPQKKKKKKKGKKGRKLTDLEREREEIGMKWHIKEYPCKQCHLCAGPFR
jgi:hypothetical protein